ncbi:MAG: protein-L-isoaspartate(D-aspartate) O-methyltransferase [Chloroflexota bacterium]
MDRFEEPRRQLTQVLREAGIRDERVLAALGRVQREAFLPPDLADRAYENVSLPIGQGQTISQPYVVGLMTEALNLTGRERVLEIGTGSGYQAAILAELAATVVSVERVPELLDTATRLLAGLGYRNIETHAAGETLGWPAGAPYDRIIVTAGGPDIPSELVAQLRIGGWLVMPVGTLAEQRLVIVIRRQGSVEVSDLGRVRFVPLIGTGAWSADTAADPPDDEPPSWTPAPDEL